MSRVPIVSLDVNLLDERSYCNQVHIFFCRGNYLARVEFDTENLSQPY